MLSVKSLSFPDIEFDIKVNVLVVIARYKKFQIVLNDGGDGFLRCLYHPEYRRLYGPVGKVVNLAINGRYPRGDRHDDDVGCFVPSYLPPVGAFVPRPRNLLNKFCAE